jgi:uncharacterized protein YndB with AHSA1/START domain
VTARFHVERHIAAPPERVWALLTDARSYAAWNRAVVSIEGDIRSGSSIRLVSTVNPKRTFTLAVSAVDAPRTMTWSDGMPLGLFTGERVFQLTPRDGGTGFAMTESYRGPMAGLITRAIPDMTESFGVFADGLKAAAEAQVEVADPVPAG